MLHSVTYLIGGVQQVDSTSVVVETWLYDFGISFGKISLER